MLDLSVSNQEIKINGYDIVRKDRNRHGGGVAIYIRTSINFIIRDDLTDDNLETITLEISKPKAKPFLINSWYKPPNTTLETFNAFEDLITRMDSENKEIILLGDYVTFMHTLVISIDLILCNLYKKLFYLNFYNMFSFKDKTNRNPACSLACSLVTPCDVFPGSNAECSNP